MNTNRLIYALLITAITIAGFTMYKQNDLGHISISFAATVFETNLVVFSALILCGLFAAFLLIISIQAVVKLFVYFGSYHRKRLHEKAQLSLSKGLIEYAEGRFRQAEKILLQYVKYSDNRLLIYLTAARAAQQLGAHDRRDDYLQKAQLDTPDANVAIGLTKAELQLAHNQNEQALATLTQLNELSPEHTYVLTLLANTYNHLQDWDGLNNILPQVKEHVNLSRESFAAFEINVCKGQLTNLGKKIKNLNSGPQALLQFWKEAPHHLKSLPNVIEHYARQLVYIDAADEAEPALRQYLNKNWQESTIILYSELDFSVDNKHLEMAESWLNDHPHDAYLLLALGKICITRSLWGKARSYLEASITIKPLPESYLILARLLEEFILDTDAAQEYYRQGLHLLAGHYGEEILKAETINTEQGTPQLKIVKS